jgi:hypothetical protein
MNQSNRIRHSDVFSLDGCKNFGWEVLTTMKFHHDIPAEKLSVGFGVMSGHEK